MPHNGGGKGWILSEETGQPQMPQGWADFLEWLLLGPERQPKHQYQWAEENGFHEDSVRRWKRDTRFIKEWDKRASEKNVNPERVQGVVDALWRKAAEGDTKAAALYLQYIDKFTPTRKVVVDDDRDTASMSDSELADELTAQISHLRVIGE